MNRWLKKQTPNPRETWFRKLLEESEKPLIQYAWSLLKDRERAKDVVQDTFLRLWSADPSDFETGAKAWLYTVCRNRAFDVLRKEKRMETKDEQSLEREHIPQHSPSESQADSHVQAAMQGLSQNQQEIIRLKFQQDLSYAEISQVLGLSISNVGVQLHMALQKLKSSLLEKGANHE